VKNQLLKRDLEHGVPLNRLPIPLRMDEGFKSVLKVQKNKRMRILEGSMIGSYFALP
jgi:hypothetical protein